jgi:hypothetical protein
MIAEEIGRVQGYIPERRQAMIVFTAPVRRGETIHIRGREGAFDQAVRFIELGRQPVEGVEAGQTALVTVDRKVDQNDHVFRVRG